MPPESRFSSQTCLLTCNIDSLKLANTNISFHTYTHTDTSTVHVVSAAVRSKVIVLLFFIVIVAAIICGEFVLVPCFVMQSFVSIFRFVIISLGREGPLLFFCGILDAFVL